MVITALSVKSLSGGDGCRKAGGNLWLHSEERQHGLHTWCSVHHAWGQMFPSAEEDAWWDV